MIETTTGSLMQTNNNTTQPTYTYKVNDFEIAIIGAGGIGSHLVSALVPALHRGELIESTELITIRMYDSDEVSKENLAHQRFMPEDVGKHKVSAIAEDMTSFTGERLRLIACPWDVREASDMTPADLTVVAVDSAVARRVVHSSGAIFLDLRCLGDGFVALDSSVDPDFVKRMTPDQPARSCQHEDAIRSGNIEFGFLLAASHGSQWVIQSLRWIIGQTLAMPPYPQSANLTFGTLGRLPEAKDKIEPKGCDKPRIHPSNLVDSCLNTEDYDCEVIREHIAGLTKAERLQEIWKIGDRLQREVSVLIDSEDKFYVDIGTSGQVKMSPRWALRSHSRYGSTVILKMHIGQVRIVTRLPLTHHCWRKPLSLATTTTRRQSSRNSQSHFWRMRGRFHHGHRSRLSCMPTTRILWHTTAKSRRKRNERD